MYKYETHCHTRISSKCAIATPEEIVEFYKSRGFDGIFVTDHFLNGNTSVDKKLPWAEAINEYCKSYEAVKEVGEKVGLTVLFGFEYSVWYAGKGGKSCGGNDFLTYGLDKEWLLAHPEIMDMELPEYCDFVHEEGGFIIHAHPYRNSPYIDMIRLVPSKVDGFEVINSSRPDDENKIAEMTADFYGLYKSAGSDFHSINREFISGIMTEEKLSQPLDLLKQFKENKVKVFKEEV